MDPRGNPGADPGDARSARPAPEAGRDAFDALGFFRPPDAAPDPSIELLRNWARTERDRLDGIAPRDTWQRIASRLERD